MTSYSFVLDANGKQLAPTKEPKAWFLIRKKRAALVSKYPMVIQLKKKIQENEICKDEIRCGIDDGGLHVGIALVQKCKSKNKVVFKGTIEQRNDVKHLMEVRRNYRRYHRYHKRYRQARFDNRKSSKRKGRIAPSILQKRQATIRVINRLNKWINITNYWLEDVSIDIRVLTDGYKSYSWQYQKSNRLDENIRKATILRDGGKCMECGKSNCRLEVDFSSYKAADALLDACKEKKLPLVLCTTGLTEDQLKKVQETSKEIPVLRSANMSLGVNTLMKLVQAAAKVLAEAGFDMEIVEKHHKLKCDAPSGTAIALADSLNEAMDNQYHYVYDRSQRHEQRDPKEIGISAVRGGTIVGDHDVIFAGPDEVVILSHRAYSKGVFGKGAVEAAKFLAGKPAGMYDMQDVIAAK